MTVIYETKRPQKRRFSVQCRTSGGNWFYFSSHRILWVAYTTRRSW